MLSGHPGHEPLNRLLLLSREESPILNKLCLYSFIIVRNVRTPAHPLYRNNKFILPKP